MRQQSLGEVSKGRDNLFDFLRFFLASLVIFSHSFAMLYNNTLNAYDPLLRATRGQLAFGGASVDGFFLISGFLITRSWEHSKGTLDYAKRRALRIMPALIVVVTFTVFVIGPMCTALPLGNYLSNCGTYKYLAMMGTVHLHETDRLPGVFVHNPWSWRVNGSLWTIRCEVLCYVLVAILGLVGVYRKPVGVLVASFLGLAIFWLGGSHLTGVGDFSDSLDLTVYFLWGMTFYLFRNAIPHSLNLFVAAIAAMVISDFLGILNHTLPILGAYTLFYIAFTPMLGLQNFARNGDLSYGLYLYAFPIEQALVSRFPSAWNVATAFLATFVIALFCAGLSWRFVESPFLKLKSRDRKRDEGVPDLIVHPLVSNLKNAMPVGEDS